MFGGALGLGELGLLRLLLSFLAAIFVWYEPSSRLPASPVSENCSRKQNPAAHNSHGRHQPARRRQLPGQRHSSP